MYVQLGLQAAADPLSSSFCMRALQRRYSLGCSFSLMLSDRGAHNFKYAD